jgi:hypothetical protein
MVVLLRRVKIVAFPSFLERMRGIRSDTARIQGQVSLGSTSRLQGLQLPAWTMAAPPQNDNLLVGWEDSRSSLHNPMVCNGA